MAVFKFHWLRRFIKRNTNPIPEETAHQWKRRLSYAYAFIAWNTFGFVTYACFNGKSDWAKQFKSEDTLKMSAAQQWAQTLKIKDATVYKISGTKISKYEIHNKFPEAQEE